MLTGFGVCVTRIPSMSLCTYLAHEYGGCCLDPWRLPKLVNHKTSKLQLGSTWLASVCIFSKYQWQWGYWPIVTLVITCSHQLPTFKFQLSRSTWSWWTTADPRHLQSIVAVIRRLTWGPEHQPAGDQTQREMVRNCGFLKVDGSKIITKLVLFDQETNGDKRCHNFEFWPGVPNSSKQPNLTPEIGHA